MLMDADAVLVERTLAGDASAFGELVSRHQRVVHRVAARVVGLSEADDVTQEAFLRAFHRLEAFRGDAPFRAWLMQIAYNAAINSATRKRVDVTPGARPEDEWDRSERGPAMSLERRERSERLEAKLGLLRPEHRAVLVLRDLEGLAYEDIAAVTGMPIGSVKGRLSRARGELIALLRDNSYDWDLPRDRNDS